MKISRSGSARNEGSSFIEFKSPTFRIRGTGVRTAVLVIEQRVVKDFLGESRHDYEAVISLSEFAQQVNVISEASGGPQAKAIAKELAASVPDLLRLALVCTNLKSKKRKDVDA